MPLTFYACDMQTGNVRDELPLKPTGDIERTIGAWPTLGAQLDIADPRCPANWADLLDPRRAFIVLADDNGPLAGYFLPRGVTGAPSAELTLLSIEGVTDRVNVRDHEFFAETDDEATVAVALLADVVAPSFGFLVDATLTGKKADHFYAFEEDRSVGSALNDLMAAEGGPEWTVRLRWADQTRRRVIKTIVIGPQVGYARPATVIENHHIADRKRIVSAGPGDMAVHVIATSDGSGPSRPMSTPAIETAALAAGVPQWEVRIATTAADDAQLDRIATSGLVRRARGVTTFEMVLAHNEEGCPQLGVDFDAGDTVQLDSAPLRWDPVGWVGPARIIGWRARVAGREFSTVTPVFWDQREAGVAA